MYTPLRRLAIVSVTLVSLLIVMSRPASANGTGGHVVTPAKPGSATCPAGPATRTVTAGVVAYVTPNSTSEQCKPSSATTAVGPDLSDPGFLYCGSGGYPFVFTTAYSADTSSVTPGGTYTNLSNPLYTLTHASGYPAWLHQDATGGGWADRFDHGHAYDTVGKDANPGTLYMATISSPCGSFGNTSERLYGPNSPFALTLGPVTDVCYQTIPATYTSIPTINILANGTRYRDWLHQYADGSGWADCFSNGNVYGIGGKRDAKPWEPADHNKHQCLLSGLT